MSPVDRAGQVTGTNHVRNYSPKILGTSSRAKVEKPSRHGETQQILTLVPIIASATVSLQLNGMLMKWKIQQAMQVDAIRTARIHSTFITVTGLNCSNGKVSSPLTEIRGNWAILAFHIWTHRNFYKGFRASSPEPGWKGWPGYRDQSRLGFIWEISAGFPSARWKKDKDPGEKFWNEIHETKQGKT